MEYPKTAVELNGWMRERFTVFIGPPQAYFELPINDISLIERRVYLTVGLIGAEERCCTHIAEVLLPFVEETIFVRREFAHEDAPERVTGRICFWRLNYNRLLEASLIYRRDDGSTFMGAP